MPYGSLVNGLAIVAGALIGLLVGSRLPKRMQTLLYQGLGLCVITIGIKMAIGTQVPILVIGSIAVGSLIGELCQLEALFMRFGNMLRVRIRSKNPLFTDGFVTASVLFCVGAMGIVGAFDEGLRDDRSILYSKSVIDFFISVTMASTMGIGVLFSAVPVFLYQGAFTIFAGTLQGWFGEALMIELVATGGIIIMGIGLNFMNITQIALSNMIPSLLIIVVLGQMFL